MLLFVLLAFFAFFMAARDTCVKASAVTSPCATELEQALFRPKICGVDYFKNLACELNSQIPKLQNFGGLLAAEFCLRFSKGNQVRLRLLNAQGIDLCTLNNPVAFEMSQIARELLLRSRNDRYTIYQYYRALLPDATLVITGPEDPDLDSIGLSFIYNFIFRSILDATDPNNVIPIIQPVLAYIRSFTISGPQDSFDLSANQLFALITGSVPYDEIATFAKSVLEYLSPTPYFFPLDSSYLQAETALFLFYVLGFTTIDVSSGEELPADVRLSNYAKTQNYMLAITGTAGIAQSFTQLQPVNVYNDGTCSYSYNLFFPQGNLVRVVLSQTDLLFKKK